MNTHLQVYNYTSTATSPELNLNFVKTLFNDQNINISSSVYFTLRQPNYAALTYLDLINLNNKDLYENLFLSYS